MSVSHRVPNFLLSKIYHGVIATTQPVCPQARVLSLFVVILSQLCYVFKEKMDYSLYRKYKAFTNIANKIIPDKYSKVENQ